MTADEALIQAGIKSLPVDPCSVARHFGVRVMDYNECLRQYELEKEELYQKISPLGFSFVGEEGYVIAVNEAACHPPRRRWTMAHELGHILLGHITAEEADAQPQEREAERFAAGLLAPLTVLHFCGVDGAEELGRLCGISAQAADIRYAELTALRRRQREMFRAARRGEPFAEKPRELSRDEIPLSDPGNLFLGDRTSLELLQGFSPYVSAVITNRAVKIPY